MIAVLLALSAVAVCRSRVSSDDFSSSLPEKRAMAVASLRSADGEGDLPMLLVAERDPSALVRMAAAEVRAVRGGASSVNALGKLLEDPDPTVVVAAARGLGAMTNSETSRESARAKLVEAYWRASPEGRAAIAAALRAIGTSLREAVEREARRLWERNLVALAQGGQASLGAAEEIGRSGRADAVQRLLPLLDPESTDDLPLIAAAARGLGQAGDAAVRPALEALLDNDDLRLREAGIESLGALGDPAASRPLARTALAGPISSTAAALDALATLPNASEVGSALCDIATEVKGPTFAERAARLARQRDADCSADRLLSRIEGKGADAAAAWSALSVIRVPAGLSAKPAEHALAVLAAKSSTPEARVLAAKALGALRWRPAGAVLLDRIESLSRKIALKRLEAIYVASRSGPAAEAGADEGDGEDEAEEFSEAEAAKELAAFAAALARVSPEGAERHLTTLANDVSDAVRAAAIEGLGAMGGEAVRPRLLAALSDSGLDVRIAAATALGQAGAAGVSGLSKAARSSGGRQTDWRIALANALAETGSPDAVPALAELLKGESAPAAALALERLGASQGARPLVELLKRPGARGRIEAIEALGQIGGSDAGPILAESLLSDRPEVRIAAARALARLRYEPASDELEALRSDYYGGVRRVAVEALAKLPIREPIR